MTVGIYTLATDTALGVNHLPHHKEDGWASVILTIKLTEQAHAGGVAGSGGLQELCSRTMLVNLGAAGKNSDRHPTGITIAQLSYQRPSKMTFKLAHSRMITSQIT